jgi:hypothetical protein
MRKDLIALDAAAVVAGTAAAFVFRTAVRSYDSVAPDHLGSLILPALPLALVACLLSLWSAGFYDPRRADLASLHLAASLAWAAGLLAFIAFYWEKGPEAPFLVMTAGYVFTFAFMIGARAFLRSRELRQAD